MFFDYINESYVNALLSLMRECHGDMVLNFDNKKVFNTCKFKEFNIKKILFLSDYIFYLENYTIGEDVSTFLCLKDIAFLMCSLNESDVDSIIENEPVLNAILLESGLYIELEIEGFLELE